MHLLHANACSATAQTRGATRTTATRPRNPGLEQIASAVAASQNMMTALRLVRRCETSRHDWERGVWCFPAYGNIARTARELCGTALLGSSKTAPIAPSRPIAEMS